VNGLGSIERALLAALFLGFFETTIAFTLGSQYRDVFSLIIMILILVIRAQGLLGKKVRGR